MSFSKGFLWGGSISAGQIEGAWDEGGKSPTQIDFGNAANGIGLRTIYYKKADGSKGEMIQYDRLPEGASYELFDDIHYTNHKASDFYHHYKEDLALMAEMGYTTFNTTVAWSRIYPHGIEGGVNKEGVEFYRDVFTEARRLGMDPVITLYKYDEPIYFELKYGGWENRAMIDEFVAFATTCFTEYNGLVNKWMTFNEINCLVMFGKLSGKQTNQNLYTATHNQMIAASRSVIAAHSINPEIKVGCMIAGMCTYPYCCDPKDVLLSYKRFQDGFGYYADAMMNGYYPSYSERLWKEDNVKLVITEEDRKTMLEGKADFLGFSYYMSNTVTTHNDIEGNAAGNLVNGIKNPYIMYSDWGWGMDPVGFKYWLHLVNDRYQKPLFDVENGLGAYDVIAEDGKIHDDYRIEYHRNHIKCMKEAVEEGVNLFGYTTWGCIDLVACTTGQLSKRYGMIYVDMDDKGNGDFHRMRKDSFYYIQKVYKSNGEDLD